MNKLYKCRGYLFCMYELLEISSKQIARECGASNSTIKLWLRRFNITNWKEYIDQYSYIHNRAYKAKEPCESCGKPLRYRKDTRRSFIFVNVSRGIKKFFCSKICKREYIQKVRT